MKTIELDDRTAEALRTRADALGLTPQALIAAAVGIESEPIVDPLPVGDFDSSLDAALLGVEGNPSVNAAHLSRADFYEDGD